MKNDGKNKQNQSAGLRQPGGAIGDYSNDIKDMIEVKTSNNYKMGKQTINARIGEDFEPEKPIVNYQQNQESNPNRIRQ